MNTASVDHEYPLSRTASPGDVLDLLTRIYMSTPGIERLVAAPGKVVVRTKEGVSPIVEEPMSADDMVLRVEMEEAEDAGSPLHTLLRMFLMISAKGLDPTHAVVGDAKAAKRWLGLPDIVPMGGKLLGLPVIGADVPADTLLMFGGPARWSALHQARYAVRISIPGAVDA